MPGSSANENNTFYEDAVSEEHCHPNGVAEQHAKRAEDLTGDMAKLHLPDVDEKVEALLGYLEHLRLQHSDIDLIWQRLETGFKRLKLNPDPTGVLTSKSRCSQQVSVLLSVSGSTHGCAKHLKISLGNVHCF